MPGTPDHAAGRPARSPQRARILGWSLLPVFLGGYWMSADRPWPFVTDALLGLVAYGVPVLVSVVLCVVCGRRSRDLERRFWYLLATANAALVLSEIALAWWLIFRDPLGPSRIAFPFQPLHLVAAVAFLGALASMTQLASAAVTARLRYLIDILVSALVLYVVALEYYARPVMEPSAGAVWEVLVGAAYPVVAVLQLLGVVVNVAGLKVVKWRSWEKLVVLAMTVYLAGVAAWPLWYASAAGGSRNEARSVLDLVQLSGHYVLVMASVYRLTEGDEWFPRPLPPLTLGRRRWVSVAFPLSAIAATAVAAMAAYLSRGDGSWSIVYGGVAIMLMVLVLVRSSLLAMEHGTLFHQSITDPLTGVYNHRYLHDRLGDEMEAAARFHEDVSLVVIDIDDFGEYNSLHGHGQGDRLLVSFAEGLAKMTGKSHAVARVGGDEFAVVLPGMAAPEASVFAQRLVDHLGIETGDIPGRITISAGIASSPEHANTQEELFHLADCAMLWAKERGKNRAAVFEPGRVPAVAGRERVEHVQRQSRLSSVQALASAVDARDPATQDHSRNVAMLAVKVGESLRLDAEHLRLLELAALMHDVGKIGVPDAILQKPGRLTAEEFLKVREHVVLGPRILSSTDLPEILPWVRHHHERWDGSGYPDGLSGTDIPLESRILLLCDAYDAMTSDRPYRDARSAEQALSEIVKCAGDQFDPELVGVFVSAVSAGITAEPLVSVLAGADAES